MNDAFFLPKFTIANQCPKSCGDLNMGHCVVSKTYWSLCTNTYLATTNYSSMKMFILNEPNHLSVLEVTEIFRASLHINLMTSRWSDFDLNQLSAKIKKNCVRFHWGGRHRHGLHRFSTIKHTVKVMLFIFEYLTK